MHACDVKQNYYIVLYYTELPSVLSRSEFPSSKTSLGQLHSNPRSALFVTSYTQTVVCLNTTLLGKTLVCVYYGEIFRFVNRPGFKMFASVSMYIMAFVLALTQLVFNLNDCCSTDSTHRKLLHLILQLYQFSSISLSIFRPSVDLQLSSQ